MFVMGRSRLRRISHRLIHVFIVIIIGIVLPSLLPLWNGSGGVASAFPLQSQRPPFVSCTPSLPIHSVVTSLRLTKQRYDTARQIDIGSPIILSRFPLYATPSNSEPESPTPPPTLSPLFLLFTAVSLAYWYLLVFGAYFDSIGFPIPSSLPLIPGWPPSDSDLAPAIEDSLHFFYISDLLTNLGVHGGDSTIGSAPSPPPPALRLAFFNTAEAWVFSFLPLLVSDKKRLPLPAVVGTWLGALGLTNAFLFPYLAVREWFGGRSGEEEGGFVIGTERRRPVLLARAFGAVATLVVGCALYQIVTEGSDPERWTEFVALVGGDRTYLAFAVDLVLFGAVQKFLLGQQRVGREGRVVDGVPFVGLVVWSLFGDDKNEW